MIDALVKILDRLIDLRKFQTARTRRLFSELVEPTYSDLLSVHRDYLQMIEQLRRIVEPKGTTDATEAERSLRSARTFLIERRIQFEPVRQKLRHLSVALEADLADELGHSVKEFLKQTQIYLRVSADIPAMDLSVTRELIDRLDVKLRMERNRLVRFQEEMVMEIDVILDVHRRIWDQTNAAYAQAKTQVAMLD